MTGTLPTLTLTAGFVGAGATDLSSRIRNQSFSISRGSSQPSLTGFVPDAGTYTTTLNNRDRALDPSHTGGPYFGDLVPGVPVALTYSGFGSGSLFTGSTKQWPQIYPAFKADQISTLSCTDGVAALAKASTTAVYVRELSGARIAAIITDVGYPGGTSIDGGTTYVPAVADGQSSSSAWSLLTDAANAEWGYLNVGADGTLTFLDRPDIFGSGFDTPIAIFGDAGGSELPYSDIVVQYDDQQIVNDADLSYDANGNIAHADDPTSQGEPWGKLSWQQNFQVASGALARSFTNEVVRRYANPTIRIDQITIKPQHSPSTLWPIVLTLEPGQMFTVKVTPKGGGSRISVNCYVRHIQHDFTESDGWTTTLQLQSGSLNTITGLYDSSGDYDSGLLYSF